jgi:hypothetical protein
MGDNLFTAGRLDDLLQERLAGAEAAVEGLPPKTFKRPKTAAKKALAELAVEVPTLDRGQAKIEVIEDSPMTARVLIPFSGDATMFTLRPTEYSLDPPEATILDPEGDGAVEFVRDFPVETSSDEITAWAAQVADSVDQYLYWQAADVGAHKAKLEVRVEALLDDRKSRLDALGELQTELDDIDTV